MKGLKLFFRPADEADRQAIDRLKAPREWTAGSSTSPSPNGHVAADELGLVAKLLGDVVAYASWVPGESMRITAFTVRSDLRRKRIGAALLAELERIGRERNSRALVVPLDCRIGSYFERRGFGMSADALVKELCG